MKIYDATYISESPPDRKPLRLHQTHQQLEIAETMSRGESALTVAIILKPSQLETHHRKQKIECGNYIASGKGTRTGNLQIFINLFIYFRHENRKWVTFTMCIVSWASLLFTRLEFFLLVVEALFICSLQA